MVTPAARQSNPLLSAIASIRATGFVTTESAVRTAAGAVVVVVDVAAGAAVVVVSTGAVVVVVDEDPIGLAPPLPGRPWRRRRERRPRWPRPRRRRPTSRGGEPREMRKMVRCAYRLLGSDPPPRTRAIWENAMKWAESVRSAAA